MELLELITTPFAIVTPFLLVGTIYCRAWTKNQLDSIDQPRSEQMFKFPGPETFYNTFIQKPKFNQSMKAIGLYKRYKLAGRIIKYSFIFSLVFNIIRSLLISWPRH